MLLNCCVDRKRLNTVAIQKIVKNVAEFKETGGKSFKSVKGWD